jgi:hypothetical protein
VKNDIPLPAKVPGKRRALEVALDLHIAMWLDDETITPSERRRLGAEKQRRRQLRAAGRRPVGLLLPSQGVTAAQRAGIMEQLRALDPTIIYHHGVSGAMHHECKSLAPVEVLRGDGMLGHRAVVHRSEAIVAAVKENAVMPYATPGVWLMIGLARHRSLPVRVVAPNGKELEQGATT